MARLISIVGMGGGFLMISPKMRFSLSQALGVCADSMNEYSPYSYIGAALGIFALLTMSLHRSGNG
jgi:spore maturation protein SpmB